MPQSLLLNLPSELLQTIFQYLPPQDTAIAGETCKQLWKISSEPLLWRYYCQSTWLFWRDSVTYQKALRQPAAETAWRQRYLDRFKRDNRNANIFESLLQTQKARFSRMAEIAESEYDAKELLLSMCNCPDDAEDVLARRYWGEQTLRLLHRTRALKIWEQLEQTQSHRLETGLGAFDLFILGQQRGDVEDIQAALDDIARDVREEHRDFDYYGLEQKVTTIAKFLRGNSLVGNSSEAEYHAMHNNFLSMALLHEPHTSLPLQSVAIFCAVAQRLGVTAVACNFPIHIYAMIPSPQPMTDLGTWPNHITGENILYLDPWRQDHIVDRQSLITQLSQLGIPDTAHSQYLAPSSTREMVLRTGRNIMRSCEEYRRHALDPSPNGLDVDIDLAFYAFLWSALLVGANEQSEMNIHRQRSYLPHLLHQVRESYPEDVGLLERYVSRMFERLPQQDEFFQLTASLRLKDTNARPIIRRVETVQQRVGYKIGTYFQHKRYHYKGFVFGWDPQCSAGEAWIRQMDVDRLPEGRRQPFYHIQ